jgi:hypothetical protein
LLKSVEQVHSHLEEQVGQVNEHPILDQAVALALLW